MEIRILLLLFLLAFLVTDDINAVRFGSFSRGSSLRGSSSRGSSSRGSSSRGSSSGGYSSRGHSSQSSSSSSSHTSSNGHTPSRPSGGSSGGYGSSSNTYGHGSSPGQQTSSSNQYGHGGSSSGYGTGSNSFQHGSSSSGHETGSNSFGYKSSSSNGHTTGSNPVGHGSTLSQSSHQQNKDLSTSLLHAEGGGAIRPRGPGFTTENKQNSAPYSPSAPSIDHLPKPMTVPSQNHASTFSRSNVPPNPSHGSVSHSNPSWSNPHYNPNQPSPNAAPVNVGFKDHLRPTSMTAPSHVPPPPYPNSAPYPSLGFNQRPPPYPTHSFGQSNQPHSAYNPNHPFPSQTIGHPSTYPAHIPPPAPGTFGNPYSTHTMNGAYNPVGQSHYPQQQILAQPAAQPYIPGQTVIMVPGQQDSGRGFGQMVKEALVFSTINAGVNRLLNPSHYHHQYTSGGDRPMESNTHTSETHITYNNHYFNGAPEGNAPFMPAPPNGPQGSSVPVTYPANYPNSANNPVITPNVLVPTILANNGSNVNPGVGSSTGANNNMGDISSGPPTVQSTGNIMNNQRVSDQSTSINLPRYRISDNELWTLTEELFARQEFNVSKYLTLHLQNTVKSQNITDEAKGTLIYTQQEVYDYPTILAIRALYDNYEHNSTVKENRTLMKQKEEDLLIEVFLNTNVMARAMRWLAERGFIDPDDFERKDVLRNTWFKQFNGATSGFERVFTSERYSSELLGVQDWIYFDYQESKKRINYMGYIDTLKLGNSASLVKLDFQMDDIIRPNATIFVGTLPELEMALYTICFYARPNDLCPVSLGGGKFTIYTHSFRYYGKDLIDLALPIF